MSVSYDLVSWINEIGGICITEAEFHKCDIIIKLNDTPV